MFSGCTPFVTAWILCVTVSQPSPAQSPDQRDVLAQARQAYYSLKSERMAQCRCRIRPDWSVLLSELGKSNPVAMNNAVQRLNAIHFTVWVGPDGNARIEHDEAPANNERETEALNQIYSGMEQMISGFFMTWSAYMISPALPEADAEYQLEQTASGYRITYKEGPADITTEMGDDFSIDRQEIVTPAFTSTLNPHFRRTSKGYILGGYEGTYRSGQASETTELQVTIGYQEVNGLQWPQLLKLKGTYGGNPFQVEVTFADCHATSGGNP